MEFALVVPTMLLVFGGILDLGFRMQQQLSLTSSVREATRWATVQPDVRNIAALDTPAGLIVSLSGLDAADIKSIDLDCSHDALTYGVCDFEDGGIANAVRGDSIRVRVVWYFDSFFGSLINRPRMEFWSVNQMVLQVPTP